MNKCGKCGMMLDFGFQDDSNLICPDCFRSETISLDDLPPNYDEDEQYDHGYFDDDLE